MALNPLRERKQWLDQVWRGELGAGRVEWRGKVQHALSGEARCFREWAELIAFVREQASDTDQVNQADKI